MRSQAKFIQALKGLKTSVISAGEGNVPAGGSNGQILAKASGTSYDLEWIANSGGGGGLTSEDIDTLAELNAIITDATLVDSGDIFTSSVIHLPKDVTQDIGGSAGTKTAISWDATAIKKDSGYTHEDVTNPSRITVTDTGRYMVYFNLNIDHSSGSNRTRTMAYLRTNGSTEHRRCQANIYSRGSGYGDYNIMVSTELDLTASDYIEAMTEIGYTQQTSILNTINAECEFILRRLS